MITLQIASIKKRKKKKEEKQNLNIFKMKR